MVAYASITTAHLSSFAKKLTGSNEMQLKKKIRKHYRSMREDLRAVKVRRKRTPVVGCVNLANYFLFPSSYL